MLALCKYYTSNVRLVAGLDMFASNPGFRFYCLKGSIVNAKGTYKVLTSNATIMVSCISPQTQRNLVAVLTSDYAYSEYNGKQIDTSTIETSDPYLLLCNFLKEKYINTKNPFQIEFGGDNKTVVISADEIENNIDLRATVRSMSGDIIVTGEIPLAAVLRECRLLKSFTYNTITPEYERSISIKKNRGEILKDISHYLNKTIVLVSYIQDGNLLEQYIGSTGSLEVTTRDNFTKVYRKIVPSKLKNADAFCIYLVAATVDSIAREQGRLLKKS